MRNLSLNIKEKIAERGLSTHALEKKAGLKPSAVQNILYGRSKNPSITIIQAIAHVLECGITDLIGSGTAPSKATQTEAKSFEKAQTNNKKNVWDQELYLLCFQEVNSLLKNDRLVLSREKTLQLVEEIYTYSQSNLSKTPDKKFAKWLIEKTKS